ncbi:sulfotransferase domain-containing protein [Pararhizobium mangrovi]|uniref:Sulfotransferase domain-containing protein n=1 Tax=Pararhizobium mangrovi TaxID=2590452 RepID=A0A506UB72_9HYPH|nr:sulfotransferase domain-containing protein [Pararhizobium mangrovi]
MDFADIDFLIIGATKSATTWLQRCLQADPAIAMPDPELHYFSRAFDRGDQWYLGQFPAEGRDRVTGEKSNSYLESPSAALRIHARLPDVKLVAQLRNPIERAYSDYCMMYRRGEIGRDVARYLDPRNESRTRLLSAGLYYQNLKPFYDRFPMENILVTFYDSIGEEPHRHLGTVRRFLGLPAQLPGQTLQQKHKDKTIPTLGPRMRRFFRPVKPLVAPLRQTSAFRQLHRTLASEIRYSAMTDDIRRRLADYYAEDLDQLSALTGTDVPSSWLRSFAVDARYDRTPPDRPSVSPAT